MTRKPKKEEEPVMRCRQCKSVVYKSLLPGNYWCTNCDAAPDIVTLTSEVYPADQKPKGAKS